jgi:hypothetical protein
MVTLPAGDLIGVSFLRLFPRRVGQCQISCDYLFTELVAMQVLDDNRELFIPETQELVTADPNFLLFGTQNPPGTYGGRKVRGWGEEGGTQGAGR